jgi:hypothetical protein
VVTPAIGPDCGSDVEPLVGLELDSIHGPLLVRLSGHFCAACEIYETMAEIFINLNF